MSHQYYVFTNVTGARVGLAHDSGWSATAVPGTDPQGRQGWVFDVPDTVPDQAGAQLNLDAAGKVPIQLRGVLAYATPTRAYLLCDDFPMVDLPAPPEPPVPPTPSGNTPLEIINAVYATGQYNLALKGQGGCGEFTEECARQLAMKFGPQWGHVAKSPGQNQYGNHAVDAIYALAGSDVGVWDIIQNSVSTSAKPVFNDAGPGEPDEWRPADPVPVQPMTSRRAVAIHVSVNATLWDDFLAALKRDPGDR